jgi:hypothetical protein
LKAARTANYPSEIQQFPNQGQTRLEGSSLAGKAQDQTTTKGLGMAIITLSLAQARSLSESRHITPE